jgi:hypothetical protein
MEGAVRGAVTSVELFALSAIGEGKYGARVSELRD